VAHSSINLNVAGKETVFAFIPLLYRTDLNGVGPGFFVYRHTGGIHENIPFEGKIIFFKNINNIIECFVC
jgi:hypothetical protein